MAQNTGTSLRVKNAGAPDETRKFEGKGHVDVLDFGDHKVGVATFEPGWKWSANVKPIAKTDSCQAPHVGYVISGQMGVVMDDQTREDFREGDLMIIPPGHDAWTIGDEACVVVDWTGFGDYAKRG